MKIKNKAKQKMAGALLCLLASSQFFLFHVGKASAQSTTWDFSNQAEYVYDSSKVQVSLGKAQLKETSSPAWQDTSWAYRAPISIVNANITDSLTDNQFAITLNGGNFDFSKALAGGEDLRFADSDGTTPLDYFIETYDAGAQSATVWVKVPLIQAASTKTVYLYFGNPQAAAAASFDGVFQKLQMDQDTLALWHFDEASGAVSADQSGNSQTAQLNGVNWVGADGGNWNGQAGQGFSSGDSVNFDGGGSNVTAPGFSMPTTGSFEAWIQPDFNSDSGVHKQAFFFGDATDYFFIYYNADAQNRDFRIDSSVDGGYVNTTAQNFAAGDWLHFAYVFEGDTRKIYINGQDVTENNDAGKTLPSVTGITLGYSSVRSDVGSFQGKMDEVRVYDKALSSEDVSASYQRRKAAPPLPSVWQKNAANPVLANTEPWEGINIDEASIIFEDNVFKAWYRGGHPFQDPFSAIGYATSPDGVNWTKYASNPVLKEDGIGLWTPFVFKHAGTYHMYYARQVGLGSSSIYTATSPDGINWTPQGEVLQLSGSENNFGNKFVFVDDDGIWKMFYEWQNNVSNWTISMATSPDGINWTKYVGNPVLEVPGGSVGGPEIHKIGSVYYMWAQTAPVGNTPTEIHLYRSADLTNWTSQGAQPNMARNVGTWENNQVADPSLVEVGGITYMFYDGVDGPTELTGVATSTLTIAQLALGIQTPGATVENQEAYALDASMPSITPDSFQPFTRLTDFSESAVKNGGEIKYQLSNDGGTSWYWYDGAWKQATLGGEEAVVASVIDANLATFPLGEGKFLFKAFLVSDGNQAVRLDGVTLGWEAESGEAEKIEVPVLKLKINGNRKSFSKTLKTSKVNLSSVIPELAGGTVRITSGNKLVGVFAIGQDGSWEAKIKAKKFQIHYLDDEGVEVSVSQEYKLKVDDKKPTIQPLAPLYVKHRGSVITWKAKDNQDIARYRITIGGRNLTVTNPRFTVPKFVSNGMQKFTIVAYDKAGNHTSKTGRLLVTW